ncbi:hypothetical protein MPNT_190025 [Candidatus Methylacidithermus pantelleriae]|uniref:Uncharacterized protein n=1 Tax=Candidatus Methylacidithermus pantelleriae TaxID=2744239 RepID=A0A8J2FSC1_9BACT|nr:hypothetical protein MPNT_190025 [Candidatus Methylacidithermus pantelleriae]
MSLGKCFLRLRSYLREFFPMPFAKEVKVGANFCLSFICLEEKRELFLYIPAITRIETRNAKRPISVSIAHRSP